MIGNEIIRLAETVNVFVLRLRERLGNSIRVFFTQANDQGHRCNQICKQTLFSSNAAPSRCRCRHQRTQDALPPPVLVTDDLLD